MKGEHNRERAIEQLLRETRHETAAPQPCVDAESLAAWSDGLLSPAEVRRIEAHASACDRCQSMLAAFARAEPAPAPAVPFWHRWRLQWLAPAVAVATALAVWVAVPRDRPSSSMRSADAVEERTTFNAVRPDSGLGATIDRTAPAAPLTAPPAPADQRRAGGVAPRPPSEAASQADQAATGNASRGREARKAFEPASGRQSERAAANNTPPAVSPSDPPQQVGPTAAAKTPPVPGRAIP